MKHGSLIRRPSTWWAGQKRDSLMASCDTGQQAALRGEFKRIGWNAGEGQIKCRQSDETWDRIEELRLAVRRLADARTRKIMNWRMEGLTFAAIAARLGLTKQRIQTIERKAVRKLREMLIEAA